jgi:cell division protein ZapA
MTDPSTATAVRVLGEEYWIRGASPELVQGLADYVDTRFQELQEARPTLDIKRLAVMVCLNIAEELFEERSHREGMLQQARRRARVCRESLEGALSTSAWSVGQEDGQSAAMGPL